MILHKNGSLEKCKTFGDEVRGKTTAANQIGLHRLFLFLYPITISYEGIFSLGTVNFLIKADAYFIEIHKEVAITTGVRPETNTEVIVVCLVRSHREY